MQLMNLLSCPAGGSFYKRWSKVKRVLTTPFFLLWRLRTENVELVILWRGFGTLSLQTLVQHSACFVKGSFFPWRTVCAGKQKNPVVFRRVFVMIPPGWGEVHSVFRFGAALASWVAVTVARLCFVSTCRHLKDCHGGEFLEEGKAVVGGRLGKFPLRACHELVPCLT